MNSEQAAAIREGAGWGHSIWGMEDYANQRKEGVKDGGQKE